MPPTPLLLALPLAALGLGGAVGFHLGRRRREVPPPSVPLTPVAPEPPLHVTPVSIPACCLPADLLQPSCEELQSQLIRQVAHALRNPLSGILMGTELLQEEDDPAHIRRTLVRITEQGLQIKDLIDQIQQAMAVQACEFRLDLAGLHLREEVQEAVEVYRSRAATKGQTLEFSPLGEEVVAIADRAFLQGVLKELLGNAVKFSPRGGVIQVSLVRHEEHLRVLVRDGGPGIRETDRARLFQPFRRLSSVPTGGESGLGLGLWTARNMARTLGGELQECAEGGPAAGACFALDLLEAVYTSTRTA